MIQITSLGLYGGSTVTAAGLANVTADTPAPTAFTSSVLAATSTGLYSGLKVTPSGLFYVTPGAPAPSDFEIVVGKITSVGLYGGLNVSTTGLYSQSTFTPSTGVTGTLAATETGVDALAADGVVLIAGSFAALEGVDVLAANGEVLVVGSFAATETGFDVFAAAGDVIVSGALVVTEVGSDVLASTGAVLVKGSLAATETGSDVFFAYGSDRITGSLAATETGVDAFAAIGVLGPKPDAPISTGPGKTPFKRRMSVTTPSVTAEFSAQWSLLAATTGSLSIPAETPYCHGVLKAKLDIPKPWVGHNTLLPNCAAIGRVIRSAALLKYKLIYPSCGTRTAAVRQSAVGRFSMFEPRVVRNPSDAELFALIEFL
jgi:hypothetical protein